MKIVAVLLSLILPSVTYALDFKKHMFTMKDLAVYNIKFDKKRESYKINSNDQSITYKYHLGKIGLTSRLKKYKNMSGRFSGTVFGIKAAFKGIKFKEVKSWRKRGDKLRFYQLVLKNKIVGSAFVVQKNKFIFSFVMIGIDLNNPVFAKNVLMPKIKAL